jgi:predicted SprT family Zn-dependent metalloprotease
MLDSRVEYDASTPSDSIAAVTARLWAEFHRINTASFEGRLSLHTIRLSTRKQYGGYYRKADSLIVLSWQAYLDHGWEETLNTFRHEVAHIVHQDHSAAFWALAIRLGCTRRHALPPKSRDHTYCRYVYECPNCKERIFRRKRLVRSSCGRCDRAFNPLYLLRLISSATRASEG